MPFSPKWWPFSWSTCRGSNPQPSSAKIQNQFAALVLERHAHSRRMPVQHRVVDRLARHHQQIVGHGMAYRERRATDGASDGNMELLPTWLAMLSSFSPRLLGIAVRLAQVPDRIPGLIDGARNCSRATSIRPAPRLRRACHPLPPLQAARRHPCSPGSRYRASRAPGGYALQEPPRTAPAPAALDIGTPQTPTTRSSATHDRNEPPRAIEEWPLYDRNGRLAHCIRVAHVKCLHAKSIMARRQVGVVGRARRRGCAPVLFKALQHVAEAQTVLRTKLDRREVDLQASVCPAAARPRRSPQPAARPPARPE